MTLPLGPDADAPRSVAAALRITGDDEFGNRARTMAARMSSAAYPDYMSSDAADALALLALSGTSVTSNEAINNYVSQQRMTRGGLVDAGQESGATVGYAATLVQLALGGEPMLDDPLRAVGIADSIPTAAAATFAAATAGIRPALRVGER